VRRGCPVSGPSATRVERTTTSPTGRPSCCARLSEPSSVTGRRNIAGLAAAVAIIVAAAVLALAASRTAGFQYRDPFDPLPSPEAQRTGTVVQGAPDPERRLGALLGVVFHDIPGMWACKVQRRR